MEVHESRQRLVGGLSPLGVVDESAGAWPCWEGGGHGEEGLRRAVEVEGDRGDREGVGRANLQGLAYSGAGLHEEDLAWDHEVRGGLKAVREDHWSYVEVHEAQADREDDHEVVHAAVRVAVRVEGHEAVREEGHVGVHGASCAVDHADGHVVGPEDGHEVVLEDGLDDAREVALEDGHEVDHAEAHAGHQDEVVVRPCLEVASLDRPCAEEAYEGHQVH